MSEPDELDIRLGGEHSTLVYREQADPSQEKGVVAAPCGAADDASRRVFLSDEALGAVQAHGWTTLGVEVGGVLLGSAGQSARGRYVRVDQALPARLAGERRAELTFSSETWAALNEDHQRLWPELQIVGWYHTHPGMGVFMSARDKFIHKGFFPQEPSIALVVDPLTTARGVYRWVGGHLVESPGYYVFGPTAREEGVKLLARLPEISRIEPARMPKWLALLTAIGCYVGVFTLGAALMLGLEFRYQLHDATTEVMYYVDWAVGQMQPDFQQK